MLADASILTGSRMRPNFLTACLDDIQRNQEYLAERSPTAARQFVDNIFSRVEQLVTFPQLGRVVPELGRVTVREVFYRHYRIIYELMPNGELTVLMVQSSYYPLDESRLR